MWSGHASVAKHWQAGICIKHLIVTASDSVAVILHSRRSALSSDIKVKTLIPSKVESEVEFTKIKWNSYTYTDRFSKQSDLWLSCPPRVIGWIQCGQTQKPIPESRSNQSLSNTVKSITLYYRVPCPPSTSGLLCDDSLSHRELQWVLSPTLTLLHRKYHKVNRGYGV